MAKRDLSKFVCLVGLLREKTVKGVVRWECSAVRDMFRARVGDYFVEVEEVCVEGVVGYFLRVVSVDGRTIDEVDGVFVCDLFVEARGVALGASKAVGELIRVLGEL